MPDLSSTPAAELRARLADAARSVPVDDFVRQGRKNVVVVRLDQIEKLVHEAVSNAIASAQGGAAAADAARIEADAKTRLDELMARHREVLRLRNQAEEALRELASRLASGAASGKAPDLDALSRQVASMAALLRGEAPAAADAAAPVLTLLRSLGDRAAASGDDRLDRILLGVERLAAAVEATERRMRDLSPGEARADSRTEGPTRTGRNLELFRAILEENLKLAGADARRA